MKKCLIFGGSGFIGSHLIEDLLKNGYEVCNYDPVTLDVNLVNEFRNQKYFQINGDILYHQPELEFDIYQIEPDIIFNFAARANIEDCNKNPEKAFDVNVTGNLNILKALIKNKVKKYVYVSSLYAQSNKSGFYGLTKEISEKITKYYAQKYDFDYVILRFGTVYGRRAQPENSITKIIKQALKTKVISYYGSGNETRNYISVEDTARFTREI
ncbi:hypothetical protein LCGC14_1937790, partial [marine sediment metagenome]